MKKILSYFIKTNSLISPCVNISMFENNERYLNLYNTIIDNETN